MGKQKELECEYCKRPIKEEDYNCPHCGADCQNTIRKWQEDEAKQEEIRKKEQQEKDRNDGKDLAKVIGLPLGIIGLVLILFLTFSLIFITQQIKNCYRYENC